MFFYDQPCDKEYVCRVNGEFPEGEVVSTQPLLVVSYKIGVVVVDKEGLYNIPFSHFFMRGVKNKGETNRAKIQNITFLVREGKIKKEIKVTEKKE